MSNTPDDRNQRPVAPPGRPQPTDWTPRGAVPNKAKTSAAAVFALIFGLSSLVVALLVFLAPIAIAFGVIALILGIVGVSKAKGSNLDGDTIVTGRGVAISGLVLGVLGLLLGIAVMIGAAAFFSDRVNLERIERGMQELRQEIPSELPT